MSDIFDLLATKTPKGISEEQLVRWTQQGAITTAQRAHEKVRNAVDSIRWYVPKPIVYLQGSYRNSTNIRGDSDVDVVVELTLQRGVFSTYNEQVQFFVHYKDLLLSAVRQEFPSAKPAAKCIKIPRTNQTVPADVVPAFTVVNTKGLSLFTPASMAFYVADENRWVVNYPKQHYNNGASKNTRTGGLYKQTVRMFKNVLAYPGHDFPGYFVECLLYNVPDELFYAGRCPLGAFIRTETELRTRYQAILRWLTDCSFRLNNRSFDQFTCQNGQSYLFGNLPEQFPISLAEQAVMVWSAVWEYWDS